MYENLVFDIYLHSTNFALPGVAVFFFLQFAMLTAQVYWVCELSHVGWKQIPGSVCVLPQVVPISQVVSKPPLPSYPYLFVHRLGPQRRSFRTPS